MLKAVVERFYPCRDASFTGIDFLTATYKTDDNSPILSLIKRPYEELCF